MSKIITIELFLLMVPFYFFINIMKSTIEGASYKIQCPEINYYTI